MYESVQVKKKMKWAKHVVLTGRRRNIRGTRIHGLNGRNLKRNRPLERPRYKWENNIKIYVK